MTLVDYTDLGTWDYYKRLIEELDLETAFRAAWHTDLETFELEVSESIVIEETLAAAPDDYILVVNERPPAYHVLQPDTLMDADTAPRDGDTASGSEPEPESDSS